MLEHFGGLRKLLPPIEKVSDIHRGGAEDAEGRLKIKKLCVLCASAAKGGLYGIS
jgi:hypothetical protein